MTTMTQETLQDIWSKYARCLDNDGDPDVVRGDYYEELARQGGLVLTGRGSLSEQQADAVVNDLRSRGCTVLHDPAREDDSSAMVLFGPDRDNEKDEP